MKADGHQGSSLLHNFHGVFSNSILILGKMFRPKDTMGHLSLQQIHYLRIFSQIRDFTQFRHGFASGSFPQKGHFIWQNFANLQGKTTVKIPVWKTGYPPSLHIGIVLSSVTFARGERFTGASDRRVEGAGGLSYNFSRDLHSLNPAELPSNSNESRVFAREDILFSVHSREKEKIQGRFLDLFRKVWESPANRN